MTLILKFAGEDADSRVLLADHPLQAVRFLCNQDVQRVKVLLNFLFQLLEVTT